ncbi:subtilase family protein [Marinobacter pelagius]|uniref:Subtilase family protein n=1 Tax=Marinobacter pelagius TaxID=379482 RepID=A0A366GWV5_9GAMM|nr:S8 family serine peptidase [Marinobacter pelagius]RBP32571.1 subtilase family protein [Marinobacter pelagius]
MKHFRKIHWLPALALASLATPVLALGTGSVLDGAAGPVTRQVEQSAERLVERRMARQVEERVETVSESFRNPLENLPAELPVLTKQGEVAFTEVAVEDGGRAVERQWLLTGTDEEIARLDQPGITLLKRQELAGLGLNLVRFRVSPELDSRQALQAILPKLVDRLDRNHIYSPQADEPPPEPQARSPRWQSLCSSPVRVGMVDTSIATGHPSFRQARVVQSRFLDVDGAKGQLSEPRAHGTAVASLMVGDLGNDSPARLPSATLFNASVFYDRNRNLSGATLGHLLEGLNWLSEQDISVLNISLTGPDNRVLATVIRNLLDRGLVLVAAVGNQGPAAPPLYPAAYPGVVGVTAVDDSNELYRWANRGEQVMFAARGVSVPVAAPEGGRVSDSGTSLAAPVVTAALACRLREASAEQAIEALIGTARDLGEPGRDRSFGHGLLDY